MLAFGHRQEAALALTGTYQPASVPPAVRRQVPCQVLGQRQIYADLDRHPQESGTRPDASLGKAAAEAAAARIAAAAGLRPKAKG